ncbi:MAG: ribokinase [Reyranella sp.]|uniref:ribokinase n=1 Tax=Reyranella sp. TaxID=1929291 RepID=UPI001219A952|nr:ribokinase [Reyranella sp.]TAJ88549.1 MAG: ribokinase [Reyranella sp.]TBR24851.1 MAG: ribokinase [Reyranella sp.]
MSRVVVCGSLNMDVVVQSARRPLPGETILGAEVSFLPGGKGLNQAIACARLGVPTAMVGAVGNDAFANSLRGFLADNDVDSTSVTEVDGPATGMALIQVAEGDNSITVASGANMHFAASMLHHEPQHDEVWVAQFETPLAATQEILARARAAGARTVLNLAPYTEHPPALLEAVDVAVLNEIELSQATGIRLDASSSTDDVAAACSVLRDRGARAVIATLGARGAIVVTATGVDTIAAFQTKVVDTTGAGDCFVGALASRLAGGVTPAEAARFASAAASCSVERLGAAPAMPTGEEVAARLVKA